MRLSNTTKELVVGNETLIKYCKSSGIDHKKLKNCSIEKMGDNYIFTLKKRKYTKIKFNTTIGYRFRHTTRYCTNYECK